MSFLRQSTYRKREVSLAGWRLFPYIGLLSWSFIIHSALEWDIITMQK